MYRAQEVCQALDSLAYGQLIFIQSELYLKPKKKFSTLFMTLFYQNESKQI
jgi:hypothetical protein